MLLNNFKKRLNRLEADLTDSKGRKSTIYFKTAGLIDNGSAFLPVALICAMYAREPLRIDIAINQKLYKGAFKAANLLAAWNKLTAVKMKADKLFTQKIGGKRVGLFFSGGVDSFYTLLRNRHVHEPKITDLIFVIGFDIPLAEKRLISLALNSVKRVAKATGLNVITVETNLKEVISSYGDWLIADSAALASVGLLFANYFSRIYISSSASRKVNFHIGSHFAIDRLWSTEKLTFVHYGLERSRLKRVVDYIAKSPLALANLRVCWKLVDNAFNCCRCDKCLRTMMELEVAGVLAKAKTFPKKLDYKLVEKTILADPWGVLFSQEILDYLEKYGGHSRLKQALERQIAVSNHPPLSFKIKKAVHNLDNKYNHDRLFWFLTTRGLI